MIPERIPSRFKVRWFWRAVSVIFELFLFLAIVSMWTGDDTWESRLLITVAAFWVATDVLEDWE